MQIQKVCELIKHYLFQQIMSTSIFDDKLTFCAIIYVTPKRFKFIMWNDLHDNCEKYELILILDISQVI